MCLSSEFGAETVGRTGRGGVEITMVIFLRFGERVGEDACGEGGKVVRARFGEDSRVGDASTHRHPSVKTNTTDSWPPRLGNWTYTAGRASDHATDSCPNRF